MEEQPGSGTGIAAGTAQGSSSGALWVFVSHLAGFCMFILLLEWLFSAFACPDYQHAEESCLVFT